MDAPANNVPEVTVVGPVKLLPGVANVRLPVPDIVSPPVSGGEFEIVPENVSELDPEILKVPDPSLTKEPVVPLKFAIVLLVSTRTK